MKIQERIIVYIKEIQRLIYGKRYEKAISKLLLPLSIILLVVILISGGGKSLDLNESATTNVTIEGLTFQIPTDKITEIGNGRGVVYEKDFTGEENHQLKYKIIVYNSSSERNTGLNNCLYDDDLGIIKEENLNINNKKMIKYTVDLKGTNRNEVYYAFELDKKFVLVAGDESDLTDDVIRTLLNI